MIKEKTICLIIILFLYFPFSAFSEKRRSDILPPTSCDIHIPQGILFDDISTDDFPANEAGTLADENYIQTISISFEGCSKNNLNIKISIDPINIDFSNGYLINNAINSLASDNVTFQLLDEENENPINLITKNTFNKVAKNNQAEFYFSLNYVKKDNHPPSPGKIDTKITFNIEINDEIIAMED